MKVNKIGNKYTEMELIQEALNHMSEALAFVYETKSPEGQALCWMVDQAVKYGTVVKHNGNILSACADYTEFENNLGGRYEV